MHWDYRVMKREFNNLSDEKSVWYEIHEVYYNDQEEVAFYTENSVAPGGETLEEIMKDFELMRKALDKPVLDYKEDFNNKR